MEKSCWVICNTAHNGLMEPEVLMLETKNLLYKPDKIRSRVLQI